MSLKATQKFRRTPKGVLTNLYSKMRERAKNKNIDLPDFNLKEFHELYLNDKKFLRIFKEWEKSNYTKAKKPSVDRINNKIGYLKNNIHIISWSENRFKQSMERRSRKGKVLQILNKNIVKIWESQRRICKELNLQQSMLSMALTGKYKTAYGYEWKYLTEYENPEALKESE